MKPDWFPDWQNECAAIVAAGPSVTQADVDKLKDRIHVVAINTSYQLCKWADILYACDANWWKYHKGAKDFAGLKVTQERPGHIEFPEVKMIKIAEVKNKWIHDILVDKPGTIGSGGNGAYQAINLLVQFGITAIMLLGVDMKVAGDKVHWHGRHPDPMYNPQGSNFQLWQKTMTDAAPKLKGMGIDVVNCSPISALTVFPRMTVDEALQRWQL